jgi:hypothetical protein
MASSKWVRVSKKSPCPICEQADWCSISADGAVAKCMRVAEGSFKSKDDVNGGCYYLHRLAGGPRSEPRLPAQPSGTEEFVPEIEQAADSVTAPALSDQDKAALGRLLTVLEEGGAETFFRDTSLLKALAGLSVANPAEFAAVRAQLKNQKVSVRDLDKALRPLQSQASSEASEHLPMYFEQGGGMCRNVQTQDGPISVPLCNFAARIVEEVVHDDGAERTRFLGIQGAQANGSPLPRVEVLASEFATMTWIVPAWGTRAVVFAGMGTKDHLRAALQLMSGDVPRRTTFQHIGWRKIDNAWVYLHAGGAIGASGLIDIPVSLPEPLAGFCLPAPPEGNVLVDAVRASLGIVGLGPYRVTFSMLAAVYRAVLGDTDFALHLAGPTGSFKSEFAALAQQHFGAGMDARHLPANWSSTGNSLEGLAFVAKDSVLVVDDFCPTGSATDVQRYHKEADRLFRGQGNRAGRQRMRADSSLRPSKPPRGLSVSTGEDTPRGTSLRARVWLLEVSPGDLGPIPPKPNLKLSVCQSDAAAGKYAAALSAFVRWLASQLDSIRNGMRAEMAELRDQACNDRQHARTPGIVADLALGLGYFLEFAKSTRAITDAEYENLWRRGWAALLENAGSQPLAIEDGEPAGMFMRLLKSAVACGYGHIVDADGNEPPEPQHWGWRPEGFTSGEGTSTRHKQQGICVGWLTEGELFLDPDSSYAAAQRLARDQNESLNVTAATLRKRLKEKNYLVTTDAARGKLTVRKILQGERRNVLHIAWNGLRSPQKTGPNGPLIESTPKNGPVSWAGSGAEDAEENGKLAQENIEKRWENGSVGRLGQSNMGVEKAQGNINNATHQPSEWEDWK